MDQRLRRRKILFIDKDLKGASKLRSHLAGLWTMDRWVLFCAADLECARDLMAEHHFDLFLVRVASQSGLALDQMYECHRLAKGQPFFAVILEPHEGLRHWIKQHGFHLLFDNYGKMTPVSHQMAHAYDFPRTDITGLSQPWLPAAKSSFRKKSRLAHRKRTANSLIKNAEISSSNRGVMGASAKGRPGSIQLPIPPKGSLRYDDLNLRMFVELARLVRTDHGYLTIRILAKTLGLSKSAVARRLDAAVKKGIIEERVLADDSDERDQDEA